MTCPGIPQGFVRFGTDVERALKLLHEHDRLCCNELRSEGLNRCSVESVCNLLRRLEQYGFIHRVDKIGKVDTGNRTQWLYSLKPRRGRAVYRPLTSTERALRSNQKRKRAKFSSIFNLGAYLSRVGTGAAA